MSTPRAPHPVTREDRAGTYCEEYEEYGCRVDVCPTGCYLALAQLERTVDMKRETLQAEKRAARRPGYHPSLQFTHAVIDSHLQALDLIDGGTTAANRTTEVRAGLADVTAVLHDILDNVPVDLQPAVIDGKPLVTDVSRAVFMLELISREMLSTDYRRYGTWADQLPRIEEEFSA